VALNLGVVGVVGDWGLRYSQGNAHSLMLLAVSNELVVKEPSGFLIKLLVALVNLF
jgi:hypothetical protein